jgi:hypothetical protein
MSQLKRRIERDYGLPCLSPPNLSRVVIDAQPSLPILVSTSLLQARRRDAAALTAHPASGGGGEGEGGGGGDGGDGGDGGASARLCSTTAPEWSSDGDSGGGESGDEGGAACGVVARSGVEAGRQPRLAKRPRDEGRVETGEAHHSPGSGEAMAVAAAAGVDAAESGSCASAGARGAPGNAKEVRGVLLQLPRGLGSQLAPDPTEAVGVARSEGDARGEGVAQVASGAGGRPGQDAIVVVVSMREAAEMLQLRPHSVCTKLEGGGSGVENHQ